MFHSLSFLLLPLALVPWAQAADAPIPIWGKPSFSLSGKTADGTPIVLCTSVMPNNTQGWGFYFRQGDSDSADKPPANCAFSMDPRPATVGSDLVWSVGMALSTTKVPLSVTNTGPPGFGSYFTDEGSAYYGFSLDSLPGNKTSLRVVDYQGSPRNGQCIGWTDKAKPATIQDAGLDGIGMLSCDDEKAKWVKGGGYIEPSPATTPSTKKV